jgi:uncharacterized protein YbjT (DUF2867 family)
MARCITVFGGTGFIGRHLVALLLRGGATVRVAARHPDRFLVATESAEAPEFIQADVLDDIAIGEAIAGADVVVNLVGILTETTAQTYRAVHVEGARRIALVAQRQGVTRMVHVSALGARPTSPAISDQTKAEGERAVLAAFPRGDNRPAEPRVWRGGSLLQQVRRHERQQRHPAADRRGHDQVPAGVRR